MLPCAFALEFPHLVTRDPRLRLPSYCTVIPSQSHIGRDYGHSDTIVYTVLRKKYTTLPSTIGLITERGSLYAIARPSDVCLLRSCALLSG